MAQTSRHAAIRGAERVGAGGPDPGLGLAERGLREGIVAEHAAHGDAVLGQGQHLIVRRASDAQRHAHVFGQQPGRVAQRVVDRGSAAGASGDAALVRHEQIVHFDVVAAAAAHPGRAPGVEHRHLVARHDQAHVGGRRLVGGGRFFHHLEDQLGPGRVGDAAEIGPAAGGAVAALDGHGLAGRKRRAAGDRVDIGVHLARHVFIQLAGEQAAVAADHHAPGGRCVGLGDLLDEEDLSDRVGVVAAPCLGLDHAEGARLPEQLHDVVG